MAISTPDPQTGDASGPFSFDYGPPFELEAELAKEIDRRSEVVDDDPNIIHPFDRHVSKLHGAPGAGQR